MCGTAACPPEWQRRQPLPGPGLRGAQSANSLGYYSDGVTVNPLTSTIFPFVLGYGIGYQKNWGAIRA